MKEISRKLRLDRQSVRRLNDAALRQAAGGVVSDSCHIEGQVGPATRRDMLTWYNR